MEDSLIMELLLSAGDHRVLSASTEAWRMVQDNVFAPFEQFLQEESREAFLSHLNRMDESWFVLFFACAPEKPFLARLFPASDREAIRLVMAEPAQIIPDHLQCLSHLGTLEALLSLSEDLFFEYCPDENSVTFFQADKSFYKEGKRSFETFAEELKEHCDEKSLPDLNSFLSQLRLAPPRFHLRIPCNLFNSDASITRTMIKCTLAHHRDHRQSVVGQIHPERARGSAEPGPIYDALTGLYNKEHITGFAVDRVNRVRAEGTTLAIVDVDYFKHVNDNYGHQFGDEVLRRLASIMETEVGNRGRVGRIGGDEFFIVFYSIEESDLRACLRNIKIVLNAAFPGKGPRPDSPISVSIGTATFPKDAGNYNDLFLIADYCLYLAKEKGRNRYIHYTPEKHPSLEEIRQIQSAGDRSLINGRDDLSPGDVLAQMQYLIRYGQKPHLQALLEEFASRFHIPLVMLCPADGTEGISAGAQKNDKDVSRFYDGAAFFSSLSLPEFTVDGMIILNNVDKLTDAFSAVRDVLLQMDVRSVIISPFTDNMGRKAVLSFASLHHNLFWNEQHYPYYRLFLDELTRYDLLAEG